LRLNFLYQCSIYDYYCRNMWYSKGTQVAPFTVNPYIHFLVNFIVGLVLSSLISMLLMQFKVTRVLIGEKKYL